MNVINLNTHPTSPKNVSHKHLSWLDLAWVDRTRLDLSWPNLSWLDLTWPDMACVDVTKEQRKPKFSAEIFLSAEIPFPLKGNRNQFLCFRFRCSRNRKHKTIFGLNRNFGRNLVASKPEHKIPWNKWFWLFPGCISKFRLFEAPKFECSSPTGCFIVLSKVIGYKKRFLLP